MNIALTVVVSAIVVLIVALVVLTIFSGGAGQIGGLTSPEAVCKNQGASSCASTGQLPFTWNVETANKDNKMVSCETLLEDCKTCKACGFQVPQTPQTPQGGTGGVQA